LGWSVVMPIRLTSHTLSCSNSKDGLDENGHYTLVLVRHGESTWNKENRFTGWVSSTSIDFVLPEAARTAQHAKAFILHADMRALTPFTESLQVDVPLADSGIAEAHR
jgi:hypothetical protein